ncbi:MAG: glycosyltransferase family 4 protein, partial [Gemmatimonadaceae bacterium]|nr:glycosyltransferase family 4 protein [Gemmatimonadaceae bacterium]
MRILFVAARFHTNQVPFVKALQEAGHEVLFDVLFRGGSEDHSLLVPTVVRPSLLSRLRMRLRRPVNVAAYHADHSFPSFLPYLRRLRRLRPDVVVVRDPNRPFARRAALAARLLGRRIVIYTQGEVHARSTRKKDLMREGLIRSLGATWFSPVRGEPSLPRVHERVNYLPFAADQDRPVKEVWFVDDRVRILAIGKFVPRKNHLLLLEAFDVLRRDHAVDLTIVGELSHADHHAHHALVMDEIALRELHDEVTVRTNVPFTDVHALYVQHDLFVLASRDEP